MDHSELTGSPALVVEKSSKQVPEQYETVVRKSAKDAIHMNSATTQTACTAGTTPATSKCNSAAAGSSAKALSKHNAELYESVVKHAPRRQLFTEDAAAQPRQCHARQCHVRVTTHIHQTQQR